MNKILHKMLEGYHQFRDKYVHGDSSIMRLLAEHGQNPEIMVIACCDSRVDPALILQCDPGDLFVVRNVANVVPKYRADVPYQGTSAALEFGIRFLGVKHLILLGHSHCGGIESLLHGDDAGDNDFIRSWVSLIKMEEKFSLSPDEYAQQALLCSAQNALTFPWIAEAVAAQKLKIHQWFFDIEHGEIFTYCAEEQRYNSLW